VERGLLDVRRNALRETLEARRGLLDRVFAAARLRFAEAQTSPPYRAGLPHLVAEALACIGDRPATLRSCPELSSDLARAAGNAKVTVVSDPSVRAGFRAVAEGGTMEVDATLDARLTVLAPALSLEILERLPGAV
jgi:vacuolar-type H+-ATPase subunit E/Vma4